MAETIPGGCYKDAEGDGYHDAHGKPVSAENVAKFLALQQPALGLGALDPAQEDKQSTEETQEQPVQTTKKAKK